MKVEVAAPAIDGETVRFRWTQSAPNPFQRQDAFFFRYEGLNLATFSPLLLYEIFLALQLKVFAAYDGPVDVTFPEPLPRSTVAFWRAFHDAEHVEIGPVLETISYEPRRISPAAPPDDRRNAVFFGGGKDSMLAACLLSELHGRESVVLIQYVGPLRDSRALFAQMEQRQERFMLQPVREGLGFATRRVWTDYQAHFRKEGYSRRPHLEFYTAGALPLLLELGVSLCTFSVERILYPASRGQDGRRDYRYAKSRPEMLATQSRHYRRVLGADLTVTNINLPFTKLIAFRLLAERYPAAHRLITMCSQGRVDERWCNSCRKCGLFAFLGLACRAIDPAFDYDRFLRESPYVRRLLEYAASGVKPSSHGNAPWQSFVSGSRNFPVTCQVLWQIAPDDLPVRIGPEAQGNLVAIKALFGNRDFPDEEILLRQTFDLLGPELGPAIGVIAAEHFPVVDELTGLHLVGNTRVEYEFEGKMPTKTALVAHLRDDAEPGRPAGRAEGLES